MSGRWTGWRRLAMVMGVAWSLGGGTLGGRAEEPLALMLGSPGVATGEERSRFRPGVRLKVAAPPDLGLALWESQPRVRGVEVRLPLTVVWVSYEWSEESREETRATVFVRRDF